MPSMNDYLAMALQRGAYDPNVQRNSGRSWLSRGIGGGLTGHGIGSTASSVMSKLVGANVWNPAGWALGAGMFLQGALTKGKGASKSARTDYSRDDSRKIMEQVYQNELGRPMEAGAWEGGIKGLTGGKKGNWLGSDGLKFWINEVQNSKEAQARRAGQQPAPAPAPAGPAQPQIAPAQQRLASKLDPELAGPQYDQPFSRPY